MIIEEYENTIKEWTDLPTADLVQLWDRFGTVYLARYDYDGMINVFQRAVKMFESLNNPDKFSVTLPSPGWPWNRLAESYKAKGDLNSAISTYETVIDEMTTQERVGLTTIDASWWAWCPLWDAYDSTGQLDGGIRFVGRLTETWSVARDQSRWNNLARICRAGTNIDRVIKIFEFATNKDPGVTWAWISLGDELCVKDDFHGASNAYETAIRVSQGYIPVYEPFWNYSSMVGYNSVPPFYSKYPPISLSHTSTVWIPRSPTPADVRPVSHKAPTFSGMRIMPSPRNGISFYSLPQGLPPMAVAQVPPPPPSLPASYSSWGFPAYYMPQITVCDFDSPLYIWFRLGFVLEAAREYKAAIKAYSYVVRRAPYLSWIWVRLNKLYCEIGDFNEAIKISKAASEAYPAAAWAWMNLGDIYQTVGDYSTAIGTFEDAIEREIAVIWRHGQDLLKTPAAPEFPGLCERITSSYLFYKRLGDLYFLTHDYSLSSPGIQYLSADGANGFIYMRICGCRFSTGV